MCINFGFCLFNLGKCVVIHYPVLQQQLEQEHLGACAAAVPSVWVQSELSTSMGAENGVRLMVSVAGVPAARW